jgi:anti-sigma regulatory factor (Ser/Thr protein kinase)
MCSGRLVRPENGPAIVSEHNLTLTEGLRAPAHARAWVNARAADLPQPVVEDMLLVVSELVTNAVRHGKAEVSLRLALQPDRVRIAVHDSSDELPVVPASQPSIDRPTGRGLLIVAATAADWGIERSGDRPGKTVWAELGTNPVRSLPNQPDPA